MMHASADKNLQVLVNRLRDEMRLLLERRHEMDELIAAQRGRINRLLAKGYEEGRPVE
jgi:hypothetical protein